MTFGAYVLNGINSFLSVAVSQSIRQRNCVDGKKNESTKLSTHLHCNVETTKTDAFSASYIKRLLHAMKFIQKSFNLRISHSKSLLSFFHFLSIKMY